MICISCKKELEPGWGGEDTPQEAIVCHGFASYGSKVFDPADSTYLLLAVCDDCLVANGKNIKRVSNEQPLAVMKNLGTFEDYHNDQ